MIPVDQLGSELASHVGCRGLGQWLANLAESLGQPVEVFMPVPAVSEKLVDLPEYGLKATISHPHAGDVREGDPDRWVINDIVLLANWRWAWPFEFDPQTLTPDQASRTLGSETSGLSTRDIAKGDLRQTYFLNDGRAVGITWKQGLVGFESMQLCRLGLPMAYEDQRKLQTI